jgi:hypothetical protein
MLFRIAILHRDIRERILCSRMSAKGYAFRQQAANR